MQRPNILRTCALVVGVLLIAGAFLTAFWITPTYVARLPDDVDVQRPLAGTFKTLLDGQALAQGSLATALKHDVPLTIDRQVKVLKTAENTALVSDARTTSAAGTKVEQTTWQYAVDRRSLEPSSHHPSNWSVVDAHGLTISFPFGAQKKTYTGWVPETATTTPVTYTRAEQRSGLQTYVYQASVTATRITDSQVLAGLPKALPQNLLKLLVEFGPLTPDQQQKLTALLPALGDPAPLSYTLQGSDTFWVEPETGAVLDIQRSQQRIAAVTAPDGSLVPLLPVIDADYRQTPAAVSDAVSDAKDGRDAIQLAGTTLPIIAGILGALLILGALFIPRRRRPESAPPEDVSPEGGDSGAVQE
ncbi:porin PorA family protein [Kitasatospora azatica]|uniref:porin PorA family protein n=1 Tax=Kitasatospora azatica TaxID=58347 RepID=UPI000565D4AE|nr:porin PorA family protein [Kitasatospora azatica]